jgi:hypothetical protein
MLGSQNMSLELSEMAVAQTCQIWWGEIDRGSVLAAPDVCHVLPRLRWEAGQADFSLVI